MQVCFITKFEDIDLIIIIEQSKSVLMNIYSGPPLMWPPLGNENCGRIRGVAAGEG